MKFFLNMVNEKAKNLDIIISDGTRRSSLLEMIHQRGRKRSSSSITSSTKGLLNQNTTTREEADTTRLLSKHSIPKLISPTRQSESTRLMKLIPDLSQKEMSRLVGAIIKRQKRDATSAGKKQAIARERSVLKDVPSLFSVKTPDSARSQTHKRLRCLLDQLLQRGRKQSRCCVVSELWSTEPWILQTRVIATWS